MPVDTLLPPSAHPVLPHLEAVRLAAVQALGLLDTDPDPEFDEIVEMATRLCGAPMGLMTLVDADRVFHKARIGMDMVEAPRSISICQYTIQQTEVLVIPDAATDQRFDGNPFIHSPGGVRFYAGAPLQAPTGERIGSLCVVDTVPRQLDLNQVRALQILARQIARVLILRAEKASLERLTHTLHESDRMFRSFMDALPVEASLKDDQGRVLYYNQKLADHFGVSTEAWIGKTSYDLWPPEIAAQLIRDDEIVLREDRLVETCLTTQNSSGAPTYWKTIKTPFHRPDGRRMIATLAVDMTSDVMHQLQMEQANKRLETMSLTDELTQLANRRCFDWRLRESLEQAREAGHALSLLLIDIDNFKRVNDTLGHRVGDRVLQRLGHLLVAEKRIPDVAARYGGEELAVILPRTPARGAMKLAERVLQGMRAEPWPHAPVTVSIGCAEFKPGMTEEDLIRSADVALYSAKCGGKDRAVLFTMPHEA